MTREMLRAKIHRITVTERNVHYEGSLTLDADLMEACGMVPYEKIDVYDVDNGNRFSTYLIEGGPGSGDCCVNGAAAHLVEEGHKLILASYCALEDSEIRDTSTGSSMEGGGVGILATGYEGKVRLEVDSTEIHDNAWGAIYLNGNGAYRVQGSHLEGGPGSSSPVCRPTETPSWP